MEQPRRFQFSLKDMFLAITLIAVGLRGVVELFDKEFDASLDVASVLWLTSLPAIGIGIGAPFGKKMLGAYVGIFVALLFYVPMLLVRFGEMWDWNLKSDLPSNH